MSETFVDPRDGETYKTVKINDQIWMAENLRYKGPVKRVNGWIIEEKEFYHPPNGDRKNIKEYGCLYSWKNALRACPEGWHLPTKDEFEKLLNYAGDNNNAEKPNLAFLALIAKKLVWGCYSEKATNNTGFSALPAGYYHGGYYNTFGIDTCFWSATKCDNYYAYQLYLNDGEANVFGDYKDYAFSVRCIKD